MKTAEVPWYITPPEQRKPIDKERMSSLLKQLRKQHAEYRREAREATAQALASGMRFLLTRKFYEQ